MGTKKIKTSGLIKSGSQANVTGKKRTASQKKQKYKFDFKPKGLEGERTWFMTRDQAIRKLQLSPEEFLRICIYKGVHPREPKKKFGRPGDTYYHTKDIDYLKNDPILATFAEMKVFDRKFKRFTARREFAKADNLKNWFEPYLNLARVIKERYPTFEEAIKDSMDDALSTLALVGGLNADTHTGLKEKDIKEAQRLVDEFYFLVAKKNLIKKGFISVKGFYLTANVAGCDVTWLQPFNFSHDTSDVVDFAPMQHFTDFYLVLLKFVNYRLYHENGMVYPPTVDEAAKEQGLRFLALSCGDLETSVEEDSSDDQDEDDLDAVDEAEEEEHQKVTPLKDIKVFLNREVPLTTFALVLQSLGAEVGFQESAMTVTPASPVAMNDPTITYHIYDRPKLPKEASTEAFAGRSFVQPQWVFDTLNQGSIASLEDYAVGKVVPVHLSPYHEYVSPEEQEAHEAAEAEVENTEERKLRKSMMTSRNRWMYNLKNRQKELGFKGKHM